MVLVVGSFEEDFGYPYEDQDPVDPRFFHKRGPGATAVAEIEETGGPFLFLGFPDASLRNWVLTDVETRGDKEFKVDYYPVQASKNYYVATFKDEQDPENSPVVWIKFASTGQIQYYDGTSWQNSGLTWTAAVWKTIHIVHDFVNQTAKVWNDDGYIGAAIPFMRPARRVRGQGFSGLDTQMHVDNWTVGIPPDPKEDAEYRIKVGPLVLQSLTDDGVQDYNIKHEDNEVGESWIEVEDSVGQVVDLGDIMKVQIVPYAGSSFEQFYYGQLQDKAPIAPDRMRITALDNIAGFRDLDIDTFTYPQIRENYEVDITIGPAPGNYARILTPDPSTNLHFPIVKVEVLEYPPLTERPTNQERSDYQAKFGSPPSLSAYTITDADSYTAFATPFTAEHSRFARIEWSGSFTGQTNFRWSILGEDAAGLPDWTDVIASGLNTELPLPTGWLGQQWILGSVVPARLNVGRRYWFVLEPELPGSTYSLSVDGYNMVGAAANYTSNRGIYAWDSVATSWAAFSTGWYHTGYIRINWLQWKTLKEDEDYIVIPGAPTSEIEFSGPTTYRPEWIWDGVGGTKGARLFYTYGLLDLPDVIAFYLTPARIPYWYDTGLPQVDINTVTAFDTNVFEIVQELLEAHDWHIRQLHRQESAPPSPLDVPPVITWEPRPSFGSPVLTLAHAEDTTNPEAEARVISDAGLRRSSMLSYAGVRLKAEDQAGRLLYLERRNPSFMERLGSLNKFIGFVGDGLYRKWKTGNIKNVQDLAHLEDIAKTLEAELSSIEWQGNLVVEGATWIVPGQTIRYQHSQRGIPLTEFRVMAIEYRPHEMTLTVTSRNPALHRAFRSIQREIGRTASLSSLSYSDLSHNFYGFGSVDDNLLSTKTSMEARLYTTSLGSPVSRWRPCEVVAGPTINGYGSKYVYCHFPPDDGDNGHGRATAVLVRELPTPGASEYVPLEWAVYHWPENSVSVCCLIYHD